jgi:hypothetical protein
MARNQNAEGIGKDEPGATPRLHNLAEWYEAPGLEPQNCCGKVSTGVSAVPVSPFQKAAVAVIPGGTLGGFVAMHYSRREFGKLALTAVPAAGLLQSPILDAASPNKPDSLFNGVQIGAITYSFRSMPDQSAEATLKYIVDSGISAVELMGGPAESYAGRPVQARGGGRGQAAPGQNGLRDWRLSVSMDKYKALRKMYNDAGVTIYAVKILSANMSDEEFEYVFNVAEALGCTHTTLELPTDEVQLKRIGDFAMRRKIYAAYHSPRRSRERLAKFSSVTIMPVFE